MYMIDFIKNIFYRIKPISTLYVAYDSDPDDNEKQVVILLHGIAATSGTWKHLIKGLDSSKYRIIAIDLLGFGKSIKPVNIKYNVDDHTKYIHKTIKKLGVNKPYVLIGHSMGSIIAAHYSRKYYFDVKELFLLSLPIYLNKASLQTNIAHKQTDLFIKMYQFLLNNKDFTIKHSQRLRKFFMVDDGIDVNEENWNSFRLSLENTIINQSTINDIKNIFVPINVIYGSLDEFLVQDSIKKLDIFQNVTITKLTAVDHAVSSRFAKKVAELIN